MTQFLHLDASANGGPVFQPLLTPFIDFDRTLVIAARDVQVHDRHLQNPAVELANLAGLGIPRILECFMRHAGQLVTRTMILDQCWDASYEGVSNLVDVHVGRVRRKLEAAGGTPLLHTIRGAGFVLDEHAR